MGTGDFSGECLDWFFIGDRIASILFGLIVFHPEASPKLSRKVHKANGVLSSIAPPSPRNKNSRLRAAILFWHNRNYSCGCGAGSSGSTANKFESVLRSVSENWLRNPSEFNVVWR